MAGYSMVSPNSRWYAAFTAAEIAVAGGDSGDEAICPCRVIDDIARQRSLIRHIMLNIRTDHGMLSTTRSGFRRLSLVAMATFLHPAVLFGISNRLQIINGDPIGQRRSEEH